MFQYLHSPQGIDPRGGGKSGNHIDIMVCLCVCACDQLRIIDLDLSFSLVIYIPNACGLIAFIQGHTELIYNLLQVAAGHDDKVRQKLHLLHIYIYIYLCMS